MTTAELTIRGLRQNDSEVGGEGEKENRQHRNRYISLRVEDKETRYMYVQRV